MAEFSSVEYAAGHEDPPGSFVRYEPHPRYFHYTQVANGTAADTINLIVLPPRAGIDMYSSWFYFTGWTSGATLSIGWKAYKDEDGAAVALSAAGLLSAVPMVGTDVAWSHGMLLVGTPDDSNPVAPGLKFFNNLTEVVIYATIGTQAPGAADVLNGKIMVLTS